MGNSDTYASRNRLEKWKIIQNISDILQKIRGLRVKPKPLF